MSSVTVTTRPEESGKVGDHLVSNPAGIAADARRIERDGSVKSLGDALPGFRRLRPTAWRLAIQALRACIISAGGLGRFGFGLLLLGCAPPA